MEYYRTGAHTRYDLKVHLVWVTKYRKQVLCGKISERIRELIREVCHQEDIEIIKGHISKDHVHLFVSYPPKLCVSKIVQKMKGKTSRKMLMEFTEMKRHFWGCHIWARGYFAVSSGNVTDEIIKQYIASQKHELSTSDEKFVIE